MNPDLVAGAVRAAKADKSDPFALHRNISHVRNGVCEPFPSKGQLVPGGYDAKPQRVNRWYRHPFTGAIVKFEAVIYTDAKRP